MFAQPLGDNCHRQPWTVLPEIVSAVPTLGVAVFAVTVLPRVRAAMSAEGARYLRERAAGPVA